MENQEEINSNILGLLKSKVKEDIHVGLLLLRETNHNISCPILRSLSYSYITKEIVHEYFETDYCGDYWISDFGSHTSFRLIKWKK